MAEQSNEHSNLYDEEHEKMYAKLRQIFPYWDAFLFLPELELVNIVSENEDNKETEEKEISSSSPPHYQGTFQLGNHPGPHTGGGGWAKGTGSWGGFLGSNSGSSSGGGWSKGPGSGSF